MAIEVINAPQRRRLGVEICFAALAALTVVSCASAASGGGTDTGPAEELPTMATNLRDTEFGFRDAFEVLGAVGWAPLVGTADFAPCGGESGVAFEPVIAGQLRRTDGRSSTEVDAMQIRDVLVAPGWGLDESEPFVDGVAATAEGWEVGLFEYQFADIRLRVALRSTSPEVDVTATGVCLPSTPAEQEFYDAMGTWYLNNIVPTSSATTEPSG